MKPFARIVDDTWTCKCDCEFGPVDHALGCAAKAKPDPCENFVPTAGNCGIDPPPWDCLKDDSCNPEIVSWSNPQPGGGTEGDEYPRSYCCRKLLSAG